MTFIQGIDYGPRLGTLGFQIHMSEGGDGLPQYLARHAGETNAQWRTRVRGVSCHVAMLTTGERVQMLKWTSTSGNINPYDRSTDKAFYGRRYLLEVLGDKWTNPNAYTLAVEIVGKRANGPTRAQVESLVEWVAEMRALFPTLRGAFGHADQTDTKGCPGTSPLMLEAWTRIGHGLFAAIPKEPDVDAFNIPDRPSLLTLAVGSVLYDNSALGISPGNITISPGRDFPLLGVFPSGSRVVAYQPSGATVPHSYFTKANLGVIKDAPGPVLPIPNCDPAVKTAVNEAIDKAIAEDVPVLRAALLARKIA